MNPSRKPGAAQATPEAEVLALRARVAELERALARQLVGGSGVADLRITVRSKWSDVLVTVLTGGLIAPRAVTFEGVVTGAAAPGPVAPAPAAPDLFAPAPATPDTTIAPAPVAPDTAAPVVPMPDTTAAPPAAPADTTTP